MKLKSVLRSLDLDALQAIRDFWELPAPESAPEGELPLDANLLEEDAPEEPGAPEDPADVEDPADEAAVLRRHLYPRLQNAAHFQIAFDKIGKEHRGLIKFLAIHGGLMEDKELHRRFFPRRREEMKDTLDAMRRHGFVFCEKWQDADDAPLIYGIPEPYLRFIELPHFWKGHLGQLLRDTPAERLARIASNGLNLKRTQGKRDRLLHDVRRALTDPERLRNYVDSLSEEEREVLFLIVQRRGVCLYRELADLVQRRRPDLARTEVLEHLLASSGLLFAATQNASKYQNVLRVPRDVYYIITNHFVRDDRGLHELDAIGQAQSEPPPRIIHDNGIAILRDIVIFVGYVERHGVRRLGNGGIGKNDLKKALTRLSANKTLKYAQFLAFYCIRRGFLVPTGDHWSISDTFRARLHNSRAFYMDVYATWCDTTEWNEEFTDGDCLHTDNYPSNLINIPELRKLVLRNLSQIPFDTWIDGPRFIESLLSQIEAQIPHRGGKARLERNNRINYLVIESMLCESLYWLGLISLGLREDTLFDELGCRCEVDTAQAGKAVRQRHDQHFNFNPRPLLPDAYRFHFQINGLARSILAAGIGAPRDAQTGAAAIPLPFRDDMLQFTILPNLDVVAPPDLNLERFFRLRQFAEVRHIDVMSVMAITRNSVRAAMDRGMKGEEILAFLEQSCPSGLPETVRHLVNECSTRYGEIAIGYAGGYIRVDDVVRLEDLRKNKMLAPFIKDVMDNRVVLLTRNADVPQIARELKKMGLMPALDNENVYKATDGRLRISLSPEDFSALSSMLQLIVCIEEIMGADLTEGKARPLLHGLEPAGQGHLAVMLARDLLANRFAGNFEASLKKHLEAVATKYRNQMRDFLAHSQNHAPARDRQGYDGPNPARERADIRKMIHFAIEREATLQLHYLSTTKEEVVEVIRPESINGDRVHAFCEARQEYCAYRLSRIQTAAIE